MTALRRTRGGPTNISDEPADYLSRRAPPAETMKSKVSGSCPMRVAQTQVGGAYRVITKKSVPSWVSRPAPLSVMIRDEPVDSMELILRRM